MKHTRKQFFGLLAAAAVAKPLAAKVKANQPADDVVLELYDELKQMGLKPRVNIEEARDKADHQPPRTYMNVEHWANEDIPYENVTTMHKALADNYSAFMKPLWFALAPLGREMEFCMSQHAVNIDPRVETGLDCHLTFKDLPCLRYDRIIAFHRYPQGLLERVYPRGNRIKVVAIVDQIDGLPVVFTVGSTINVKLWGDFHKAPARLNNIHIEWPDEPLDLGGK